MKNEQRNLSEWEQLPATEIGKDTETYKKRNWTGTLAGKPSIAILIAHSCGILAALRELQLPQDMTILSMVFAPLRGNGTTWSNVHSRHVRSTRQ